MVNNSDEIIFEALIVEEAKKRNSSFRPYKIGYKHSPQADSIHGEKTKDSMIGKFRDKVLSSSLRALKQKPLLLTDLSDLVRGTQVVKTTSHIPFMMDQLKHEFPDLKGDRPFYPTRGYGGPVHLGTTFGGFAAEIKDTSAAQFNINSFAHREIYAQMKKLPPDSPERMKLEREQKGLYNKFFEYTHFMDNDLSMRAKIFDYGRGNAVANIDELPIELVRETNTPPYSIKNNQIVFDENRLDYQAGLTQLYAADAQKDFNTVNQQLFRYYNREAQKRDIEPTFTKRQTFILGLFEKGLTAARDKHPHKEPEYIRDHYYDIITNIEKRYVIPKIEPKTN